MMPKFMLVLSICPMLMCAWALPANAAYPIVDTAQNTCYNNTSQITCPTSAQAFYGQDAQYHGSQPSYVDNGDGTITDLNTALMWQKSPDLNGDGYIDSDDKLTFDQALAYTDTLNDANFCGYNDWRLPGIKELYSLILFSGTDVSGCADETMCPNAVPFIDTNYFAFGYGDTSAGERMIDAQYFSGTEYVSTTMHGDATAFGVNFADGRIKGYPAEEVGPPGGEFIMTSFVRYVRGNTDYGVNNFINNGDGTITDLATGLMWTQNDNGSGLNWQQALDYAENLSFAGHNNWRLPNAKELHSIVDYTRSPATTSSAAIDPIFNSTAITDEGGSTNYPFYWASTTHKSYSGAGNDGVYVCFGEALGWMQEPFPPYDYTLLDVHGAGAQRSDPKAGDPADYPYGRGPQGDVIRIYNYVRCVRVIPPCWYYPTQCHGDANGDGFVDTDDWPYFRDFFQQAWPDYDPHADFNRNGTIDTDDWPAFRDNFQTAPQPDCTLGGTWPPF